MVVEEEGVDGEALEWGFRMKNGPGRAVEYVLLGIGLINGLLWANKNELFFIIVKT